MDSPKIYPNGLKTSVTLILIISLTFFPSNSAWLPSMKESKDLMQKKLVLGSRPPRCVNKCLSCRPCMAALVISPHNRVGHIHKATAQRDEGYYLLSWKCKCGNKFFQP
ncbi:EPIDERMAL PATTERNING FACTOR-like protein 8 [Gastrolobium bilobum]|uniref:EPIDERMAL PATTERNING FACTOR-like protein 8 n=1 Tax=Gastrolobium bilobum TaxID=150636 RepID=UPI002AB1D170|nr:EPIDERMAL PATTERNING FACTOR-like protein 8 [Gastrolobium bilobum]